MQQDHAASPTSIRYEPNDKPPTPLTVGLGLQFAILSIAGIVLTPAIVVRAADGSEAYLSWAVFAAAAISGISTIGQAIRVGRVGAGYVLLMGTSGAFIAVCVAALVEGGPALMATLVVASSLFQFLLSSKLSLFRRLLTPTVAGTVLMLIGVTVMPLIFDMVAASPEGAPAASGPVCAAVTLAVVIVIALRSTGSLRLWAPVIGIAVGSLVAALVGIYETDGIAEAAWFGLPDADWPGFDFGFGGEFWALLPAFVFVTLIGAIETIGDSVAIQRVSWRKPRAVDYRAVQGAVAADGTGNLLSGLLGTMPNTTYSSSISLVELTGVAARRVGVAIGGSFIAMALLPKMLAAVLAVPEAVVAAYATVLLALLFVVGMKIVVEDASDYRNSVIAGIAFWLGVGFQHGVIFPEYMSGFAGGFLENGMTAGGLAAMIMTLFVELTQPRRQRLRTEFDLSSLPEIQRFVGDFAVRSGWDARMKGRLEAVGEEALLTLLESTRADEGVSETADAAAASDAEPGDSRYSILRIAASKRDGRAIVEFAAAVDEDNLEDRIAVLTEQTAGLPAERDVSLRILQHHASSVLHQQYHGLDIVTVHVDPPPPDRLPAASPE